MSGTEANLVTQAASAWKEAKQDRDKCARAQAGTPDGNRYPETKRRLASARAAVDKAYGHYKDVMNGGDQGAYIKPLSYFGVS